MARFRPLLLATLAVQLLAAAAAGGTVADEREATPVVPAAEEESEPAPMSVEFPRRQANLVGARALVFVRCSGIAAQTCEGTLVLRGIRGAHKVPYSIDRGERQALAVPLGDGCSVDRGAKARAVARTLQLSGSTVRTSSILRLR